MHTDTAGPPLHDLDASPAAPVDNNQEVTTESLVANEAASNGEAIVNVREVDQMNNQADEFFSSSEEDESALGASTGLSEGEANSSGVAAEDATLLSGIDTVGTDEIEENDDEGAEPETVTSAAIPASWNPNPQDGVVAVPPPFLPDGVHLASRVFRIESRSRSNSGDLPD